MATKNEIRSCVQQILDKEGYTYVIRGEGSIVAVDIEMEDWPKSFRELIYCYDDQYSITVILPCEIEHKVLPMVSEYLMRINQAITGEYCLFLNYDIRSIALNARSYLTSISEKSIELLEIDIYEAPTTIARYCENLLDVIKGTLTPAEAIKATEERYKD